MSEETTNQGQNNPTDTGSDSSNETKKSGKKSKKQIAEDRKKAFEFCKKNRFFHTAMKESGFEYEYFYQLIGPKLAKKELQDLEYCYSTKEVIDELSDLPDNKHFTIIKSDKEWTIKIIDDENNDISASGNVSEDKVDFGYGTLTDKKF